MAFRDLIQKHKEAQGQAVERANWERKRNDLLASKRRHQEMHTQMCKHKAERGTLLAKLHDLRDRRFALRQGVAEKITSEVSSPIRVRVEQCGNRELYQGLLAEGLKAHATANADADGPAKPFVGASRCFTQTGWSCAG